MIERTIMTVINGRTEEHTFWREHTTIALQPIAAPSILGLYGLAGATFVVAANIAGWYGNDLLTPLILFPFAAVFGGVAQLLAGMWAYRARDGLATAIHGMWGSFWIGYGVYFLLVALGALPGPAADPLAAGAFGFWFVALAAITWVGTLAAVAENAALTAVLGTLAAGSTLLAIALLAGTALLETIAGYVLVASALLAWYTASAMVLEGAFKRVVLPVGKKGTRERAGAVPRYPIQYDAGEPGVKVGQ
jgi:succinate-acetate transporter protein